MRLTRRDMLAAILASGATQAFGAGPMPDVRPRRRGDGGASSAIDTVQSMVDRAWLDGGKVSFAVADARTGEMLETRDPDLVQPPASTAKALTTLYHLGVLGPDHRFETRLLATGPIFNGRIDGDLILAGGGDPTLDTSGLAELASALKDTGVREVGGYLRIWTGALPSIVEIDDEQPDHVSYNPSIGGLNLNFNRVHFGWKRVGADYQVDMDARAGRYIPGVTSARMAVVDRRGPIYTYRREEDVDDWTVARTALGESGSRWLPIRHPGLYAGEVFQVLARSNGIQIGGPVLRADAAEGTLLAQHHSGPSNAILKDMLEHSTNITAEIMGLSASEKLGPVESLPQSATRMGEWLKENYGLENIAFEDHSGLGDDSRISATDMTRAMVRAGPDGPLRAIMKPYPLNDRSLKVDAKTGTLNFVTALTGYITGPRGRPLAFSIFCSDTDRRDTLTVAQRERPEGGRAWANRSRTLQRALLARWATLFGA
ncbi:D-alanyl-D-alanine carboxypeptidase/D-alanyl-D-alanine-endopeptidase [Palleronia sp. LCG004]|uniref:D-alanyl-D-alanine carboxypeptidase/D-alanyl-D-alanine endopeptidase n=1 Tax=Palleronia sp. LCG004 TaxID=3079304 RepID=UPI0029425450|nr:D-alanyl-D-alanine carboxypeptidase/D-alanyl-D-alanine-endopeptidase [Palleronia sp. LCG004]WOI57506.1 D-alanyl-D-alanine carboxypeptidase/D-alanyl-D-alanine-endopeptidase [Palleronia sp. LCG004]